MNTKSYKYPLLNDEDWLRHQYLYLGKSTRQIASLAGAKTCNSARQALLRHGIKVRSVSEGLTHGREEDGLTLDRSLIEGCLLGDGSLICFNPKSRDSSPYFKTKHTDYNHVRYVAQCLFGNRWSERIDADRQDYRGNDYCSYAVRSLSNPLLRPLFEEWYPDWNDYRKVVPRSIRVDAKVLLHWFLDDGNSYQRRPESRTKQICITLCSECFAKEDQE